MYHDQQYLEELRQFQCPCRIRHVTRRAYLLKVYRPSFHIHNTLLTLRAACCLTSLLRRTRSRGGVIRFALWCALRFRRTSLLISCHGSGMRERYAVMVVDANQARDGGDATPGQRVSSHVTCASTITPATDLRLRPSLIFSSYFRVSLILFLS